MMEEDMEHAIRVSILLKKLGEPEEDEAQMALFDYREIVKNGKTSWLIERLLND